MKNIHLKIVALFTVALSISSCSKTIFISKPLPPEISLENTGQKMVIQNFFDYTQKTNVKEKHMEVFKAGTETFSHSLSNYLSGSNLIFVTVGDSLVKSENGRMLSEILNPDYIISTCDYYGADLLLAFDSLFIDFDWETVVEEYDDGSKSKTKHFFLQLRPYLSLYKRDGTLIDRSFIYLEHHYSSRPTLSGLITIKPALIKAIDEVILLSNDAGEEYGAKFFETMGSFPYKVYYSKPFDVSFRLMLGNQWADAIRDLLPLAESPDSKTAKRAANNLYVAYSGLGDNVSAAEWLRKSK